MCGIQREANLIYLFFFYLYLGGVEFCHSTRNASKKFGRKWGTECLNTRFPLPTLLCAGYSVKLILISRHRFHLLFSISLPQILPHLTIACSICLVHVAPTAAFTSSSHLRSGLFRFPSLGYHSVTSLAH